jgi:hypothetical protein
MSQLFFKKALQTAIREGRKRTTIRRWDRPRLRAGREAFAPGLGWLMIDRVESVELDGLADGDARADGFASVGEMRQALCELYPAAAHDDGKQWFRVCFTPSRLIAPRAKARCENIGPGLPG